MATIRLPELTVDEAEAALARLWTRLEEHALVTPNIVALARSGTLLELQITFASPAEAELAIAPWKAGGAAAA